MSRHRWPFYNIAGSKRSFLIIREILGKPLFILDWSRAEGRRRAASGKRHTRDCHAASAPIVERPAFAAYEGAGRPHQPASSDSIECSGDFRPGKDRSRSIAPPGPTVDTGQERK